MSNQASLDRKAQRAAAWDTRPQKVSVSPVPISSYFEAPDAEGVVFRFIMPSDGTIISGTIVIEELPKEGVEIQALAEQKSGGVSIITRVEKPKQPVEMVMGTLLKAGDRITVRMIDKVEVRGVWVGFLWLSSSANVKLMEIPNEGV
jgi:hypothetical protein